MGMARPIQVHPDAARPHADSLRPRVPAELKITMTLATADVNGLIDAKLRCASRARARADPVHPLAEVDGARATRSAPRCAPTTVALD